MSIATKEKKIETAAADNGEPERQDDSWLRLFRFPKNERQRLAEDEPDIQRVNVDQYELAVNILRLCVHANASHVIAISALEEVKAYILEKSRGSLWKSFQVAGPMTNEEMSKAVEEGDEMSVDDLRGLASSPKASSLRGGGGIFDLLDDIFGVPR